MSTIRQNRINDEVAREIAVILRSVKDPRISESFVSITYAEVTKDLSIAKVFYSIIGDDKDVDKGLESAGGFIRKELAKRLNLRITPKLIFVRDNSVEYAMNIMQKLKDIEVDSES